MVHICTLVFDSRHEGSIAETLNLRRVRSLALSRSRRKKSVLTSYAATMLKSIIAATCLLGTTMALSLTPSGAMHMKAIGLKGRSSMLRMDDIQMTKPADANVVVSDREPFECSFEIPKKGISEYGTCNMNVGRKPPSCRPSRFPTHLTFLRVKCMPAVQASAGNAF